ncbi:unnamed protein product, partial [marine sediment metagenome]
RPEFALVCGIKWVWDTRPGPCIITQPLVVEGGYMEKGYKGRIFVFSFNADDYYRLFYSCVCLRSGHECRKGRWVTKAEYYRYCLPTDPPKYSLRAMCKGIHGNYPSTFNDLVP